MSSSYLTRPPLKALLIRHPVSVEEGGLADKLAAGAVGVGVVVAQLGRHAGLHAALEREDNVVLGIEGVAEASLAGKIERLFLGLYVGDEANGEEPDERDSNQYSEDLHFVVWIPESQ